MLPPTSDGRSTDRAVFVRLLRGVRLGTPILLGYVPVGLAFGVLARKAGFSAAQAVICSATALAGAGQFIALSSLAAGGDALAALAATTIVNLRYVLFSAALAPSIDASQSPLRPLLAFTLTDETFAVNTADARGGTLDALSAAGVGAVAWLGWVSGTAVGATAAGSIADPSRFGSNFAMPAMFTALLVGQIESRRHAEAAVAAAGIALAAAAVLPGTWGIIVGAVVGAAYAAWRSA
ncbi:MAG: AzlC family ABC transporter permease [Coriobacteriia bacterium]|nr:AzlC family ABC transporter permease [Coriobacteriia bacterium]